VSVTGYDDRRLEVPEALHVLVGCGILYHVDY
jgi:hypothetical protein